MGAPGHPTTKPLEGKDEIARSTRGGFASIRLCIFINEFDYTPYVDLSMLLL